MSSYFQVTARREDWPQEKFHTLGYYSNEKVANLAKEILLAVNLPEHPQGFSVTVYQLNEKKVGVEIKDALDREEIQRFANRRFFPE